MSISALDTHVYGKTDQYRQYKYQWVMIIRTSKRKRMVNTQEFEGRGVTLQSCRRRQGNYTA